MAAAPERGRANAEVLRLLSQTLGVPVARLSVVSGHAARDKVVELSGLDEREAARRLVLAAESTVRISRARTEQAKDAGSAHIERDMGATEDAGMRRFAAGRAERTSGREHSDSRAAT